MDFLRMQDQYQIEQNQALIQKRNNNVDYATYLKSQELAKQAKMREERDMDKVFAKMALGKQE